MLSTRTSGLPPSPSFFTALVFAAAVLVVRAQEPAPAPPAPAAPAEQSADVVRFKTGADLVVLHVSVKDRRGRDIDNLPESAFSIYEDGARQPISVFTNEDVPVTVGLVVDSSISMFAIRTQLIAAAGAFAAASHPQDEMFALAFNEQVRSALPASAPFTSDAGALRDALERVITPRGRTALFDAVAAGLGYAARGRFERRMLVVISDGGDNASHIAFADAVARTRAANVVIFSIALRDEYGEGGNPKVMKALAEASGGAFYEPKTIAEVSDALNAIAHELRHSYTVGYVMPRPEQPGFRTLRVEVHPPAGTRVTVRTRAGYVVPGAPAPASHDPD